MPPVCLVNWVSLRVVGLNNATITSGRFGAVRGIFEFINCRNVSIENLAFVTSGLGRATLFFEACRDVSVSRNLFSVNEMSSLGVQILHTAGDVRLSENTFYGDSSASPYRRHLLGVDVTHGCRNCTMPFSDDPYDFSTLSFSLVIAECIFQDLASEDTPQDSYSQSRNSATGLRLRMQDYSADNSVSVTGSRFQRIANSAASGVLVTFSGRTEGTRVMFENCTFQDNRVRYGGGVAAYFYRNPARNTLEFRGCSFVDNTADFEGGGVFAVFLSSGDENTVLVSDSSFVRNHAQVGSGLFFLNNPAWFQQRGAFDPSPSALVQAELRDCVFEGNNASLLEGVVDVLRVQLTISGSRYGFLLTLTSLTPSFSYY